jgi:phage shock protein E
MVKGSTRVIWIIVALVLALLIYGGYQYAVFSPYRVSSEKAKDLLRDKQIDMVLDVRTDIERDRLGSYPGSVSIQRADLEERMQREFPKKDTRILVYCNTGHRARMATDALHRMGYRNTVYISSTYESLLS